MRNAKPLFSALPSFLFLLSFVVKNTQRLMSVLLSDITEQWKPCLFSLRRI